ncbi:MAG: hypothetical protein HFJ48_03835 [Clostridia bacterium]|nr:hypothetical protein [Clostridia bacterium]
MGKQYLLDAPTYESAGKGYAWIMINYSTLSDENKEELFAIEETRDKNGSNVGQKIVWLIKGPSCMYTFGKNTNTEEKNELYEKFKAKSFVFMYNSDRYPKEVAILRMPINSKTTVKDVELYFDKLIERFRVQQIEINNRNQDRE